MIAKSGFRNQQDGPLDGRMAQEVDSETSSPHSVLLFLGMHDRIVRYQCKHGWARQSGMHLETSAVQHKTEEDLLPLTWTEHIGICGYDQEGSCSYISMSPR